MSKKLEKLAGILLMPPIIACITMVLLIILVRCCKLFNS